MDLLEKYYKKINDLIEEAKAEGVNIMAYSSHVGENNTLLEQGIYVIKKDTYKKIPTWKK